MLLLAIYNAVKGDALTQRPIPEQIADIEAAFSKNAPWIAAYGLRRLIIAHGHKNDTLSVITGILNRLKQGPVFVQPQNNDCNLLERSWNKEQCRLARKAKRNPPSSIDTLFSLAMSGYFAPSPATPLQHAQQAVLDGLQESVKTHREEPQMVPIIKTLLDLIVEDEPRRVQEAAEAILDDLTPKLLGLGFCMDTPQSDLPDFLNRQFIATDPLRRTLKARYLTP